MGLSEVKTRHCHRRGCLRNQLCATKPVLTPNHFFHGQAGGQVVDEIDFQPRRRWLQLQQLVKGFWKRWLCEFFLMFNARRKWTEESKELTVVEVVLCLEPGLPKKGGLWEESSKYIQDLMDMYE